MALIIFPPNPINGQEFPVTPPAGTNVYMWEAATSTWRLLGTASGVAPGCYGNSTSVGTFCVDAVGRVISAATVPIEGFVKLNNASAYNNYVWPNIAGSAKQVLQIDGVGNLSWVTLNTVKVQPQPSPVSPIDGDLWFDCTTGNFYVYQSCVGAGGWFNVGQPGLPINPTNVSATPAFIGGAGTSINPYQCIATNTPVGSTAIVVNTVIVTGLAPNQAVQITDLNAVINSGRFSFSNTVADATGQLVFQIIFQDRPNSPVGTTYLASIRVGYATAYIDATVNIVAAFSTTAGSISGTPNVGQILTYTRGVATSGVPPYTYTWAWQRDGVNIPFATGLTYTLQPADLNAYITVTLRATDSTGDVATATTAPVGPVTLDPFPPAIWNPVPSGQMNINNPGTSSGVWNGPNATTVFSTGCVEISVNGVMFSNTVVINSGQTLYQRWKQTPGCGLAASGTTISGTVYTNSYLNSYSLTLDRVPSPSIADISDTNVNLLSTVTEPIAAPIAGLNSTAYVNYASTSSGTSIQASTDNLTFVTLSTSGTGFAVTNGQTLYIRQTVGSATSTGYTAIIRVGDGTNTAGTYDEFVYTATTTASSSFPNLPPSLVTGPTQIPQTVSGTWADGPTTLTSTGCILISLDNIAFNQGPLSITNGNTLYTKWNPTGPSCGGAASGSTLTGTITNGANVASYTLSLNRVPTPAINDISDINVNLSTTVTKAIASPIAGINATAYVTYDATSTGTTIQASTDNVTFTTLSTSGTGFPVTAGQTLYIRQTVGSTISTGYTAVIRVGDGTNTAGTYDEFTYTATTVSSAVFPNLPPSLSAGPTQIPQTVTGNWADGTTSLTSTGCLLISSDNVNFNQGPLPISNGNALYLKWNTTGSTCGEASDGTTIVGTLTNGVNTQSYSLTIDRSPAAFTLTPITGQALSTTATSNTVTLSGTNAATYITYTDGTPDTLTSPQVDINGTGYVAVPLTGTTVSAPPGATLTFKADVGSAGSTAYTITFNAGSTTSPWSVTTIVPAITTPSITSPANGTANLNPLDYTPAGIPLTADAYAPINGAPAQASSTWEVYKWVGVGIPAAPTTEPPNSDYTAVTGSPFTVSTSPYDGVTVPDTSITTSSYYYARVKYTSIAPVVNSSFSTWSSFSTAATFPPTIGSPYQGGYFGGQINLSGTIYNLVVAPVTQGSLQGQTQNIWSFTANNDSVADNTFYGAGATTAYANPSYPLFNWAINNANGPNAGTYDPTNAAGSGIGGYNDWYIPSIYELMILYYYFKPDTTPNSAGTGINPYAVAPCISPFTNTDPGITTAANFIPPATNSFSASNYASATQFGSSNSRSILFTLGDDMLLPKTGAMLTARAIRRVLA